MSHPLIFRDKPLHQNTLYVSASFHPGVERVLPSKQLRCAEETKERLRKLFRKAELSVSSYDTAWVAMVPSTHSSKEPCFPQCVNWILENQLDDGSWALPHHHSLLLKDVLSSTLACVIALRRWDAGDGQIKNGIRFIESHFASAADSSQVSPLGFDIIFPGMLEYAKDLSLNLCLESATLSDLLRNKDLELKRCYQSHSAKREARFAYISEGMGKLQDLESLMKYQRKNGSLFNCPSTTATALLKLHNTKCLDYLNSTLQSFGNAVPAVYPLDIYAKLCTVDNVERLGISRHFEEEIRSVLDETHRRWLQGDEEVFLEASTCALAFRILRMNGYDVSSDPLIKLLEEDFSASGIDTALELYQASEMIIHPDESCLEKQSSRIRHFLEQKYSVSSTHANGHDRCIDQQVNDVLRYPFYANLERVATRRNIKHYKLDNRRILKTSYCSPNFSNKDFLILSAADFNICQKIHLEEFKDFQKLDKLNLERQKPAYCYFTVAMTSFSAELSDVRMSWAKNALLTAVIDDLFDFRGSIEELRNLTQLLERWDTNASEDFCSEDVKIIFLALCKTIYETGEKASAVQGRNVTNHIAEIWLDLLKSMLKEAEWANDKYVPTIDEYMSNAYVSFALGPIVLPALYLVGLKISEEVVQHSEYHKLFWLMSSCGRLLNDIRCFERESKEGKITLPSLYMINAGSDRIDETAFAEIERTMKSQRRELLGLVLQEKNSVVPKACKKLFWHMTTVLQQFYIKDDGFHSEELISVIKDVIDEPIVLDAL